MTDTRIPRRRYAPAILALADGTIFRGLAIRRRRPCQRRGDVAHFMTGYQEILTDPSRSRQIARLSFDRFIDLMETHKNA